MPDTGASHTFAGISPAMLTPASAQIVCHAFVSNMVEHKQTESFEELMCNNRERGGEVGKVN